MAKTLFGLAFGPAATKFIDRMPNGKLRAQIIQKTKSLIYNPHPVGCKKIMGMKDVSEPVWRIRSGDYRILYVVREMEVVVLDIGNRKDIYK